MSTSNCKELGLNMQKIVARLLANDELVKLLFYEDKDPLGHDNLTQSQKENEVYQKLIKIVPRHVEDETNKSVIIVYLKRGSKVPGNSEFVSLQINIDIFVPLSSWIIKDINLRPFAILGQIQDSLEGKTINGLGKIQGGDFELTQLSDKTSVYSQVFRITEYD